MKKLWIFLGIFLVGLIPFFIYWLGNGKFEFSTGLQIAGVLAFACWFYAIWIYFAIKGRFP